ncbi:family 20 glycosylhydrolase [Francisella philomiragia]|nr:family 20 glycosylhydrolase [Francisella philomiragia]MBK2278934.1 family 20 glycosylhydrolase [Francisella philomiragia]MBK2286826.1 family 20 glycosylhydrolase [Francisella philomiragia]MBK2288766.1 family 20 glycosylhydrolase [Francisella philomiragia]MBK2290484.1 family 20 glycosylhydrolase [Francisella philomiragia]
MKKNLIAVLLGSQCLLSGGFATDFDVQKIQIKNISQNNRKFDMSIDVKINQNQSGDWLFGFYMPRTYNSSKDVNPNLTLKVTDLSTKKSANLSYVKKADNLTTMPIYADGYSNLFRATTDFELEAGHIYRFSFENNNLWVPGNISSLPQSFFLIDSNGNVVTSTANLDAYISKNTKEISSIQGYDSAKINIEIQKKLQSYVDNSIASDSSEFANQYHLIPTPLSISNVGSKQNINLDNGVYVDDSKSKQNIKLLNQYFKTDKITTNDLKAVTDKNHASIILEKDLSIKNKEGYILKIIDNKVYIRYQTNAGLFYAIQTLRNFYQKDNVGSKNTSNMLILPQVTIKDQPRFQYRGILLDVARHYFSVQTIKTLIDAMASQKLNTLHIHFSDDEGFRLALDSVDVKKASTRGYNDSSTIPAQMYQQANLDKSNYFNQKIKDSDIISPNYPTAATIYEGYYSKKDIQEIISYANARQITVIPEIDLPGHAKALIDSAPDIFINKSDKSDYISVQGYYDDVLPVCLYNQSNTQGEKFTAKIDQIVTEIYKLFDNQNTVYFEPQISVGGDEVSADAWTNDSTCENQKDLNALEKSHNFFKELQQNTNLRISGWQQTVQNDPNGNLAGGIDKNSIPSNKSGYIWVWSAFNSSGYNEAQQLAKAGYSTVLAYADDTYFDLSYNPDFWEPGFYWATKYADTHAALNSALDSKTAITSLSTKEAENIKGLEGALWSENINNANHLWYMAFPKMIGLAEASWADPNITVKDKKINWNSLVYRLGTDNTKFLGYIDRIINPNNDKKIISYRGYPNGISQETPKKINN